MPRRIRNRGRGRERAGAPRRGAERDARPDERARAAARAGIESLPVSVRAVPVQRRRRSLGDSGARPRDAEGLSPPPLRPGQRGVPERRTLARAVAARPIGRPRARAVLVPGGVLRAGFRVVRGAAARGADSLRGSLSCGRRRGSRTGRRQRGACVAARGDLRPDGGRSRALARALPAGAGGRAASPRAAGDVRQPGGGIRVERRAGDRPPARFPVRCPWMRSGARRGDRSPGAGGDRRCGSRRPRPGARGRRTRLDGPRAARASRSTLPVSAQAPHPNSPRRAVRRGACGRTRPLGRARGAAQRDPLAPGRRGTRAEVSARQSGTGLGDGDSRPCRRPAPRRGRSRRAHACIRSVVPAGTPAGHRTIPRVAPPPGVRLRGVVVAAARSR